MGLDMYLTGRKYLWPSWDNKAEDLKEDGRRVKLIEIELGYWRKHPNLHGYMVQRFMKSQDKCQELELSSSDLTVIIEAVKDNRLPHTTGFFFGESQGPDDQDTIAQLTAAQEWLDASDVAPVEFAKPVDLGFGLTMAELKRDQTQPKSKGQRSTRQVLYQASW